MPSASEEPTSPQTPRFGVPEHLARDMNTAEQGEWLRGVFRRNSVTRRAAIKGSLGSLGVLALSSAPWARATVAETRGAMVPNAARPSATGANVVAGRHIGYGNDPRVGMWVSGEFFDAQGNSPNPGNSVVIDYGLDSNYGTTQNAEVRQLVTTLPNGTDSSGNTTFTSLTQYFVHGFLANLTPGTKYHWRFRLTTDGTSTSDSTFSTAPAAGSTAAFTFTAFADHGLNLNTVPSPYAPATGNYATDDYYKSTGRAQNQNPPEDPIDTMSDRSTTGRRQNAVANRTTYPANALVDVITSQTPVFNLVGGDIAYADPDGDGLPEAYANSFSNSNPPPTGTATTRGYFDELDPTIWSAYFAQNERSASNIPWMFALGNHDIEACYDGNPPANITSGGTDNGYGKSLSTHGYTGHASRINLLGGSKSDNSPSPSVYSFRYANVGVVAIDCNDLSTEIQSSTGFTNGAQATWLDMELGKLRGDSTIDYVVAFFHHCAYATSSNHHSDGGVRAVVAPLFTKWQVDIVFQGHNHQFERSDPLKYVNGKTVVGTVAADQTSIAGWQGTTYINNGSAGRPRYGMDPDAQNTDPVTGTYTERFRNNPNPQGSEFVNGQLQTSQDSNGNNITSPDAVSWSQARYDDYAVCCVDVQPATPGSKTSLVIRTLNDFGTEIDRVTLAKTAGASVVTPPAALAEAPMALLLPAAGLLIAGGVAAQRRRSSAAPVTFHG